MIRAPLLKSGPRRRAAGCGITGTRTRRAARVAVSVAAGLAWAALVVSNLSGPVSAAESCDGKLGTARTLTVDTTSAPRFGTKSYPSTLPLGPREVVLTFDDGPFGRTTDAVLAALDAECVKATFFVVGRQAAARPDQLRRIAAAGHTIAHHSMTHPVMTTIPFETGRADIEQGWRTVDRILYGRDGQRPVVPFFRFPGFAPTPELAAWLQDRQIATFGADFWGSDWQPTTPDALLAQVLDRLERRGGGILLLHDIHAHTAAMVPPLLTALKARGYKVVHIVPGPSRAS